MGAISFLVVNCNCVKPYRNPQYLMSCHVKLSCYMLEKKKKKNSIKNGLFCHVWTFLFGVRCFDGIPIIGQSA